MNDNWQDRAECKELPTGTFFPAPDDRGGQARAIRICQACPVAEQCLDRALETGDEGVWGGTTLKQRRKIRRQRSLRPYVRTDQKPRQLVAACGTDSGYYRHRRNKETPCESCKAEHVTVTMARLHRAREREERECVTDGTIIWETFRKLVEA